MSFARDQGAELHGLQEPAGLQAIQRLAFLRRGAFLLAFFRVAFLALGLAFFLRAAIGTTPFEKFLAFRSLERSEQPLTTSVPNAFRARKGRSRPYLAVFCRLERFRILKLIETVAHRAAAQKRPKPPCDAVERNPRIRARACRAHANPLAHACGMLKRLLLLKLRMHKRLTCSIFSN